MPVQQPIPTWFGGHAEAVLRRVARLGDGWMPNYRKAADALPSLEKIDHFLEEAGRSRVDIGLEARIAYGDGNPHTWSDLFHDWQKAGASHISFNTMDCGFNHPQDHIQAISKIAETFLPQL